MHMPGVCMYVHMLKNSIWLFIFNENKTKNYQYSPPPPPPSDSKNTTFDRNSQIKQKKK